jgi:gluconate 5-dehydrogenase
MLEQFRLDGKRVVVTGSSRGLGLAVAQYLAKAGAELVLAARDGGELEKVAAAIIDQTESSVIVAQLDVTNSAEVEDVFEGIDRQGKIDVLVNCAGIQHQHSVEKFPDSDWDEVLATNLTGTFYYKFCICCFECWSLEASCIFG